jgi:hypothetical protein
MFRDGGPLGRRFRLWVVPAGRTIKVFPNRPVRLYGGAASAAHESRCVFFGTHISMGPHGEIGKRSRLKIYHIYMHMWIQLEEPSVFTGGFLHLDCRGINPQLD